jgi:uncharacterized protein with ATP-grasp and redox domains
MFMGKKPAELIPEPLRGSEPDSFAHYTITVRFPRIINQVLQENDLPAEEQKSLKQLLAEIPEKPLRPLLDQNSPDARMWSEYLHPYTGQNWLQTPWFFCETYFFRRIIEAIRYYEKSLDERLDPYHRQKESSLDETLAGLRTPMEQLPSKPHANLSDTLPEALIMGVWGNQTDLSMWPAGSNQGPDQVGGQDSSHLLVNEANLIVDHLLNERPTRVDLILDNAAAELSRDLLLADLLVSGPMGVSVHLHAKPHPTYVSDATAHDVHMTVEALTKMKHRGLRAVGQRLAESMLNGRLQIHEHYFWTSPLSGWQMPDELYADLAKAQLIISKGDANYRRFLGDRHWPFTTPFTEITHYRPAPLAALRVLKSEVACGLKPEQPALIRQKDPDWLIDGRWGVIQFAY